MQATTEEQRRLIASRNAAVEYGVELLDDQDRVVADLSPDVLDAPEVRYDVAAKSHRDCQFDITRPLDWDRGPRVRLWQSVSDGSVEEVTETVEALDVVNRYQTPTFHPEFGPSRVATYGGTVESYPGDGIARLVRPEASTGALLAMLYPVSWAPGEPVSLRFEVRRLAGSSSAARLNAVAVACYNVGSGVGSVTGETVSPLPEVLSETEWAEVTLWGGNTSTVETVNNIGVQLLVQPTLWAPGDGIEIRRALIAASTEPPPAYFDGNTPDTTEHAYRWDGTPHGSSSSRYRRLVSTRLVEEADRYNLGVFVLTTPDERVGEGPGLAEPAVVEDVTEALDAVNQCRNPEPTTTAGWAGHDPVVVAAPWDPSRTAYRATSLSGSTPYIFSARSAREWRAGETVYVRAKAQVPVGYGFTLDVHRRDTNRYFTGRTPSIAGTGQLVELQRSFVLDEAVPADQLDAALVYGAATVAGVEAFMGDVQISDQPFDGPYFDGDTPDTTEHSYRWDGTPHASTSSRYRRLTSTRVLPAVDAGSTYTVQGYDKLHLLQHNVPDTYVVAAGTTYLDAVRQAIIDSGYTGLAPLLAGAAEGKTLTEPLVWVLDVSSPFTWLQIINRLLAAVGYVPLWADPSGRYRSQPHQDAKVRPPEWVFDLADPRTNIVSEDRSVRRDAFDGINWWRFVQDGRNTRPVEGDGQYTVDRTNGAPRHPAYAKVTAADQEALVLQGDRQVALATQRTRRISISTGPLPVLGHDDVATFKDPVTGTSKVRIRSWSMPLDGSGDVDMELEVVE